MLSDYIKDKDPLRVLHTLFFEDPLPFDEALSRQLTLARNNNQLHPIKHWAEELQDLIPDKKTAIRLLKHYGANLKDDLKDNPWILYIDEKQTSIFVIPLLKNVPMLTTPNETKLFVYEPLSLTYETAMTPTFQMTSPPPCYNSVNLTFKTWIVLKTLF